MMSPYRQMWVVVFFDLPTETKEDKRNYVKFRKRLLEKGYMMIQYSVYARPIDGDDRARHQAGQVAEFVPPAGEVRVALFTDRQWGLMRTYVGKNARPPEKIPEQLGLF